MGPAWRSARGTKCRLGRALCHLDDLRKSIGAIVGDAGEGLAVHLHTGLLEAVNQARVRKPVLACGRVEADDPQGTEFALANLAVAIGEFVPADNRVQPCFELIAMAI